MTAAEAELQDLAARLRARVGEGRYGEAHRALEEYCQALRKIVAALPGGDPRRGRLQDDWLRLAEETRRRVLAGRAHAAAGLARLPKRPLGYGCGSRPRHTWACLA
jgi:hypothetical protein